MLTSNKNPWIWVPSLYFAEGVPYFLVNNISVIMFAKMGVPNDELAFFTTLLYFPWFLKGLWAPIVDVVRTKRWWIIAMQALLAVACVLLVVSLPHPDPAAMTAHQTPVSLFWLTLVLFIIAAFASATHDIAADGYYMLAHDSGSQAKFIGIRSTFYRIAGLFIQGALVLIAGRIERTTGNIPYSWQITLAVTAIILFVLSLYHTFALPRVETNAPQAEDAVPEKRSIAVAFSTFFTKRGIWLAVLFMLLYRLPEGLLVKLSMPFLVDAKEITLRDGQIFGGGLGLSTEMIGVIYGLSFFILLAGGILGGIYISRHGLKRSLWLMAALLTLPNFVYVYLSAAQPDNLWIIAATILIEQFGYGFGFTAYMLYMMYFSEGEYKTSHYAICTAFMALSMMIPGFVAGKIELAVGYNMFFWIAIICSITTVLVTAFAYKNINETYGKKI